MLSWLDPRKQDRLKAELRSYKAEPLERNDVLEWNGPSLFPQSTVELASTASARRTVVSSVLTASGPSHSSSVGWSLKLVEPLKVGEFSNRNNNQVWRCQIGAPAGESEKCIVIKLYYDGVFFHRDGKMGPPGQKYYMDGEGLAENEALAYNRLRLLQGIAIPFCYGFFKFSIPGQNFVIGSVLEDLTSSRSLVGYAKRLNAMYTLPSQYTDELNPTLLQCYRTLDQIHQQHIAFTAFLDETSFFLPAKGSATAVAPIILMGFSHARRAEDTFEWKTEGQDWIRTDRACVTRQFGRGFGADFDESHIWSRRYQSGRMLADLSVEDILS